jgi:PD-(D/E)XK nuclease superfamily
MKNELKISRTGIEQHIRCPKCFFMQRKLGLKPPSMVPLTLAVATDALLKNEFDTVRTSGSSHPLWKREGLNLRAFQHADIDVWRSNFKGMRVMHESGTEVYGAVDDVWENLDSNELHIVDYKSTSKKEEPTIETGFGDSYKRQMEIYQWLFRKAGFKINSIGYFLYVNGSKQGNFYQNGTEGVMHFETTMISYSGDDSWVNDAVTSAVNCLKSDITPNNGTDCDNCRYYADRFQISNSHPH